MGPPRQPYPARCRTKWAALQDRLGFEPKRIDALFGAKAASWDLSSLTDIQLTPTLRKLRVTVTTDTGRQRFLVSDGLVVYQDLRPRQSG